MTGGMGGGGHAEAAPAPAQAPQQYQQQQQQNDYPCQMELKQFLECSQNQTDISLCYGFNEALKECRMRTGKSAKYELRSKKTGLLCFRAGDWSNWPVQSQGKDEKPDILGLRRRKTVLSKGCIFVFTKRKSGFLKSGSHDRLISEMTIETHCAVSDQIQLYCPTIGLVGGYKLWIIEVVEFHWFPKL